MGKTYTYTDPEVLKKKREIALENIKKAHTPEAEARKKEGVRAYQARRKNFRNAARDMMEAGLPDHDAVRAELERRGFKEGTYQAAILLAQLKKAAYDGDTEAAKFIRDSAGYKPTENVQVGNMDDVPFVQVDLSKCSSAQLREMIAMREARVQDEE